MSRSEVITAIVLVCAETDKVNSLAEKLVRIDGVREVYSIAGRYDLAMIVCANGTNRLADIICDRAQSINGILSTETLIAFRAYSEDDRRFGSTLFMD